MSESALLGIKLSVDELGRDIARESTTKMPFGKLYRELCNDSLSKPSTDTDYFEQRVEVMRMIGLGNTSGKKMQPKRVQGNKYHGKEARYRQSEARLKAIGQDSATVATKRLAVARAVNEVQKNFEVSKKLGTFVKNKKPFPPSLMRELLGKDATRKPQVTLSPLSKKKPVDFGPSPKVNVPKLPVLMTEKEKYKWHKEERDYLNKLYEEMEGERPKRRVPELWDIYYRNMYERFKPFYPHRTRSEVEAKIGEMISKRQFVSTKEKGYWEVVGAKGPAVAAAERRERLAGYGSPEQGVKAHAQQQINIINDLTGPGGQLLSESMQLRSLPSPSKLGASVSKLTM